MFSFVFDLVLHSGMAFEINFCDTDFLNRQIAFTATHQVSVSWFGSLPTEQKSFGRVAGRDLFRLLND